MNRPTEPATHFPWDIRPGMPLYLCVGCRRWYRPELRPHHLGCLARVSL